MTEAVKAAFAPTIVELQLANLLPTRQVTQHQREGVKFRRIASSIAEVGLVEPLVVAPRVGAAPHLLLDGHLRLCALRDLGASTARCLVADDHEAFTYNKRINRLAPIQEHHMIVRAIERGVAQEKLARARCGRSDHQASPKYALGHHRRGD